MKIYSFSEKSVKALVDIILSSARLIHGLLSEFSGLIKLLRIHSAQLNSITAQVGGSACVICVASLWQLLTDFISITQAERYTLTCIVASS